MAVLKDGSAILRDPSRKVIEVHAANGAVIWHSTAGVRHFEWERPDGRLFVAHGRDGYIQRPFESRGERFVQRTYIRAGTASTQFYRPWAYQDVEYYFYVRSHYHRPGFYAWAAAPFQRPFPYRWEWEGLPWYEYYVTYFQPYPIYTSPVLWLTDFTLATTLQLAFLTQGDSAAAPFVQEDSVPAASALTAEAPLPAMAPEVKRALADEIRRQMRQAKTDQAAGESAPVADWVMPALFTDRGPRVFLVSAAMTGVTSGNTVVSLAPGDVLGLTATPDPGEAYTRVKVLAATGSGCAIGSVLLVSTEDLVESLNLMQATVDQGLEKLRVDAARVKPGQGPAAFPPPPADAGRDAAFVKDNHPDPRSVTEFTKAAQEADLAEKAALFLAEHPAPETQAHQAGLGDQEQWDAAAALVKVHMDISEVDRLLGKPDRQASGPDQKTYIYLKGQVKINFFEGKVTEVIRVLADPGSGVAHGRRQAARIAPALHLEDLLERVAEDAQGQRLGQDRIGLAGAHRLLVPVGEDDLGGGIEVADDLGRLHAPQARRGSVQDHQGDGVPVGLVPLHRLLAIPRLDRVQP